MKKLVVATNNKNKLKEINAILNSLNIEALTKADVGQADFDVEETGTTLEANALLKAKSLKALIGDEYVVIADDTGLFVDFINGEPGVHTARYAGVEHDDKANNEKLIKVLSDVPTEDRTAEFRTVIALVQDGHEDQVITGILKGKIAEFERGDNGFGYDPVFIPESHDETFAELGTDYKNSISHRHNALEKLYNELKKRIEE